MAHSLRYGLGQRARQVVLVVPLFIAACGGGGGGSAAVGLTVTKLAEQTVGASGGTVTVTDSTSALAGTTITVPSGALPADTTITVSQVTGDSSVPANVFEVALGPSGTQFQAPVTVTLKYSQAYLDANGITDANTLKIVAMDPGVANETLMTTSIDTTAKTITAETTHFSNFAALGYTNATLKGSYHYSDYYFDSQATNPAIVPLSVPSTPYSNNLTVPIANKGFTSEVGTVTFDGAGGLSVSYSKDEDGVASTGSDSGSYTVAADGTVTLPGGLNGRVLAGGSLLVFTSTSGDPEIGLATKDDGVSYSMASVSGSYTYKNYYHDSTATNDAIVPYSVPSTPYSGNLTVPIQNSGFTAEGGSVTFDGQGNLTVSYTQNRDGTTSSGNDSGTYTVSSDGTVTLPGGLSGHILAGGSLFVFASSSGDPEIGAAVKAGGSGYTNASLHGTYGYRDYYFSSQTTNPTIVPISVPSTPYSTNLTIPIKNTGFTSEFGTVTFDGAGGLSVSSSQNQDGASSSSTDSGTYSIADDGTVTLPGGLSGQLIAGGSAFIFHSTSGDPEFGIAVLQ